MMNRRRLMEVSTAMYKQMGTLKSENAVLAETKGGKAGVVTDGDETVVLKKALGWLDLTMLGIGGIIGAGVFVLTGVGAQKYAGPSVVLSFVVAGFASLLSALCYSEFAVDVPVAGSAYNYISITFGEFAAWICGWNLILEYSVSVAAVSRGWTSYLATLCGVSPSTLRVGTGFFSLDPCALGIIILMSAILIVGIKESANFNNLITGVNLVTVAIVLFAGMPNIDGKNYSDFAPFGVSGIFTGASVVFFSYIGFDTVATVAEEVKRPERDLPIGIIGSLSICTVLYVLMSLTITGIVPYQSIDVDAPFSAAFHEINIDWAGKIVSIGAVTGITTSLLVSLLGQTRIYMVIARDSLVPPWLGRLNKRFKTPVNATLITAALSGVLAFFIDIDTLSEMVSIGTLFVFAMVNAAILMRRYALPTGEGRTKVYCRTTIVLLVSSLLSLSYHGGWHVALISIFAVIFVLAVSSFYIRLPVLHVPAKFGTPLCPWVPCLGILANIHLVLALGKWAYVRFVVWCAVGFLIYAFYGYGHSVIGKNVPSPLDEDGEMSYEVEMQSNMLNSSSRETSEKGGMDGIGVRDAEIEMDDEL